MNLKNNPSLKSLAVSTLAGTLSLSSLASQQGQDDEKPNFLFILADDLGYKDLGAFGSSFYESPNIDELALDGVKFTNAYAASSVSSPTRSSIMTGKNPARTNNTDWFGAPQPDEAEGHWVGNRPMLPAQYKEYMDLDEITLAEALKEAGYATFFAGKWHLGHEDKYWPTNQGFDINKGGWSKGRPYRGKNANGYFSPYGIPTLENGPEGEYLPYRLADETVNFIDNHQEEPFLAYLSFYEVHTPLMAPDGLVQKYQQKKEKRGLEVEWGMEGNKRNRLVQCHPVYSGMIEAMDRAIGTVLAKLEAAGLEDNTIVIFMSDNGGLSIGGGEPTANIPLRAGKGWLYEGGIREPMIVKWPGVTEPGTICDEPVISTDFYPTILDMAGLSLKPEQHKDGRSLAGLLKNGEDLNRQAIHWHYPHNSPQGSGPASAIRMGQYKLIKYYYENKVELYDLSVDIREHHDISDDKPELTAKLLKDLNTWLDRMDASFPSSNPEYEN